jgi:hypothetical protein
VEIKKKTAASKNTYERIKVNGLWIFGTAQNKEPEQLA